MKNTDKDKILFDTLQSFLNQGITSKRDSEYAKGFVEFYFERGYFTEKQRQVARKLAVRLIIGMKLD